MKVRKLKRYHQAQAASALYQAVELRGLSAPGHSHYVAPHAHVLHTELSVHSAIEQIILEAEGESEVEDYKKEYVVIKKSTQEVVGTFDQEADALAMIDRAKKQKKAALELLTQ